MRFSGSLIIVYSLAFLGQSGARAADAPLPPRKAAEFFEKSVRPVLAENCFGCHNEQKQKGGLRLDSRQAMLNGGDTGPALVPGHPEQSLLLKAIHYKDDLKMPPKGQLRDQHIANLTSWIKQGDFLARERSGAAPGSQGHRLQDSAEGPGVLVVSTSRRPTGLPR